MDRRRFLVALVPAPVALAGCGGDGEDTTQATPADTDTTEQATTTAAPDTTTTATPTATQTETADGTSPTPTTTTTTTATPTKTPTPVAQTVAVAADGFAFTPETFEISVGETVRWEWAAGGHNVVESDSPSGADWKGTEGAPSQTFSSGHTYSYEFTVAGEYSYYCAPHRDLGMTGSFTVTE